MQGHFQIIKICRFLLSFLSVAVFMIRNLCLALPDDIGLTTKKKKDEYKSKVKPRTVWDKPDILDLEDTTLRLKWKPSSIPDYAAQVPIWYIVEQRCPPSLEWTKLSTDCKETEFKVRAERKKRVTGCMCMEMTGRDGRCILMRNGGCPWEGNSVREVSSNGKGK